MSYQTPLDHTERLLAMVRRAERFAALQPEGAPSHDMMRMLAEVRVHLSASPTYRDLAGVLLVGTLEGVRGALARLRARLTDDQRLHLRRPAA